MTVEQIRARVMKPNRCWSDTHCDCVQQRAAERMLKHYDALAAERDRLALEIHYLRLYGNSFIGMADDALAADLREKHDE